MTSDAAPSQQEIDQFVGNAHGRIGKVREFVERHPDHVNAPSSQDETALEAAAHTGQVEIAEFLLDHGAPLDICTAAMLGRRGDVQRLLDEEPDRVGSTGAHGIPLMFYPALGGHRDVLELLLERGADVNQGDGMNTALHGAAAVNGVETAQWLLDRGARPDVTNYEDKTPRETALEFGQDEVAEVLDGEHGG